MLEGVENGILADVQSKTGISRRRLKHTKLRWLGVGECKASESTENCGYTRLFAENIKKNTHVRMQFSRKETTVHFCSQWNMKVYLLLNRMMCSTLTKKGL